VTYISPSKKYAHSHRNGKLCHSSRYILRIAVESCRMKWSRDVIQNGGNLNNADNYIVVKLEQNVQVQTRVCMLQDNIKMDIAEIWSWDVDTSTRKISSSAMFF
jgi:hypothetical protein